MSTTNLPSTNITLQDAMETTYLRRTIVCTIGRLHMFFLSSNICCIIYNYILMIILLPFSSLQGWNANNFVWRKTTYIERYLTYTIESLIFRFQNYTCIIHTDWLRAERGLLSHHEDLTWDMTIFEATSEINR